MYALHHYTRGRQPRPVPLAGPPVEAADFRLVWARVEARTGWTREELVARGFFVLRHGRAPERPRLRL